MTRSKVIAAVRAYLTAHYTGPIAIHPETSAEEISPPYAVVRVGSAEYLYDRQAEILDINLLIGVFHDADTTTAETAEAQAAELFAMLDDADRLFSESSETLVWSALERIGSEASISETRWQHIAAFRGIVAPAAD